MRNLLIAACGITLLATPSLADVYLVNPQGTGDFPTIQAAIDDPGVVDGDIIELTDGIFTGDGNRDIGFRGKAITLRSQSGNTEACIIDCEASSVDRHRGFRFAGDEGPGSVLSGLTIINAYAPVDPPLQPMDGDRGGAVICFESSPIIEYCRITDCAAGWGGGMQFWDSAALVRDCVVTRNFATMNGGGIYSSLWTSPTFERVTITRNGTNGKGGGLTANTSKPVLRNCTVSHNSSDNTGALWTLNGAEVLLENSIISFSTHGASVLCETAGSALLICCDVYGNQGGDWVDCIQSQQGQNGNIRLNPLYCDAENGDFLLHENSPCRPFSPPNPECDLIGAWPVGCGPTPARSVTWGVIKALYGR